MKQRVIHVFTHDSIGLGEDGPTHQSIEHAASLRLIPNLDVWRPADTAETAIAWACAIENRSRPTALLLLRQNLPYPRPRGRAWTTGSQPAPTCSPSRPRSASSARRQAVIVATGSEVQLALHAQQLLAQNKHRGARGRMPSTSVFDRQDAAYQTAVLPRGVPRIAVEMGRDRRLVEVRLRRRGRHRHYGESAPAPALFKHFGFTAQNVADTVRKVLRK